MGLAFSRIWERMFGKKEMRILMVDTCVEIKILRRVRAESPRRPPRHRRDACSMARCRFLVHPTRWLISTQNATIESDHQYTHLFLAEHALPDAGESQPHG